MESRWLNTKEELQDLDINDRLLVYWNHNSPYKAELGDVSVYDIWGVYLNRDVVLDVNQGIQFNINDYLEKKSIVKRVYLIRSVAS